MPCHVRGKIPCMAKEKCTQDAIKQAVMIKRAGALDKDIAAVIGVHPSTLSHWVNSPRTENQRQLRQALKEAEAEYKGNLLKMIYNQAVKGTWQAAAWLLERKYPDEYARRERREERTDAPAPVFEFDRGRSR